MHHLTSVVALAGSAYAAGASTIDLGSKQTAMTEYLLQKARPYKKNAAGAASRRRLDQNFQIDGSYSVLFSRCVDIKLLDDDLFDENVIEYTKAGSLISTKSYALFHVCQGDDCYYESEDDLFIVDLATYVKNVASYHANLKSEYCDACDTYYYGYCNNNNDDDDGGNNDDAVNQNDYADDDAGRRRTTSYIDCDQCESYGCLNNGNNDQQEDNGVVELIEDISQCLNAGMNWNDEELFVGFMCDPYDGSGVELALFVDDECTVYTNTKAFSDIPYYYIYNDEDVFTEAEKYIKYAFTETTPCLNEEFGNPNYQNNDDAAAANNNDGYEVNDYCQDIFDQGSISFNSNSCAQNSDDDANNNNFDDANNNNQNNYYDWYTYDMNYDDTNDIYEVCSVINQLEGEYSYQYDSEKSGTWNNHGSWWGGGSSSNKKSGGSKFPSMEGISPTSGVMIFLYVMIGVALIVGVFFAVGLREKKRRERLEPVYLGGKLV